MVTTTPPPPPPPPVPESVVNNNFPSYIELIANTNSSGSSNDGESEPDDNPNPMLNASHCSSSSQFTKEEVPVKKLNENEKNEQCDVTKTEKQSTLTFTDVWVNFFDKRKEEAEADRKKKMLPNVIPSSTEKPQPSQPSQPSQPQPPPSSFIRFDPESNQPILTEWERCLAREIPGHIGKIEGFSERKVKQVPSLPLYERNDDTDDRKKCIFSESSKSFRFPWTLKKLNDVAKKYK
jgi:hypothetical protein